MSVQRWAAPPGELDQLGAAISEGFCPACGSPLVPARRGTYRVQGDCERCATRWALGEAAIVTRVFSDPFWHFRLAECLPT